MPNKKWCTHWLWTLILSLFLLITNGQFLLAQPEAPTQLFITDTNAGSPPTLELQVYGIGPQGEPLDLHRQLLTLKHNNVPVTAYEFGANKEVGTFTVFLIDIPSGVTAQFEAIKAAIQQYAAPPIMREQVDAIAIYEVGLSDARPLLPPDRFYNSVTNFLTNSFAPTSGATALIDSTVDLLEEIPDLKPDPAMAASVVIISDGTDAVSTRFQASDITNLSNRLGIPIHTIWLTNQDLTSIGQQQGQDFLIQTASRARGLAINMENATDWAVIWNRITSFRSQTIIRYQIADLQGGTVPVELALMEQPGVTAVAEITLPTNMPSIQLNLPEESRIISLPDLNSAIALRFSTTYRWLDGVDRTFAAAQLVVNGVPQEIRASEIASFTAEISNLRFGPNTLQIAVLDNQGMRATSPVVTLQVNQGRRVIPDDLSTGGGLVQTLVRGVAILLIAAVLAGGFFFIWRQGLLRSLPALLPKGGSRRRGGAGPQVIYEPAPAEEDGPRVLARLVVLDAISKMPPEMPLIGFQVRLGRSPQQADIAFENDLTVSRLHATMMLEGNYYRIFDEGSTSGTWVNEKQVPEYGVQLVDGDEIHLGAVHLRFYQP